MKKSDLIAIASLSSLREHLVAMSRGAVVAEWIKEGLQDRGLIDHRDKLTDAGHAAISNR